MGNICSLLSGVSGGHGGLKAREVRGNSSNPYTSRIKWIISARPAILSIILGNLQEWMSVNVIPFPEKTNYSYLTMENSINYFNEDEPIRNTAHSDMTQPTSAPDYTLFHRV